MLRLILLTCLIQLSSAVVAAEFPSPRRVDERRAAQVGLRKIVGRHLRLYTDLPPSDAVDGLPVVFDAAVPLWADYFGIDMARLRDWRMQGYLIQDRAKFAALGLMPRERPDIATGYSNGYELWLVDQPSDYYRRHLLLHEGTHGFMYTQLGDTGPGWYMEGMAELFGTHRWQRGKLDMRVMPSNRKEVPMWGRIKLIRDANREDKPLALPTVLGFDKRRVFSTEEYAWCWALCEFLDSHPHWQPKFHELKRHVGQSRFNQLFRQDIRDEWGDLLVEWQAFVATLDYGYDSQRMAMQHMDAKRVGDGSTVTIDAARGWQSTGWLVDAGDTCEVTAVGRYQIAKDSEADDGGGLAWPCEPGGVTLEYHEGRPLGMLVGAWREVSSQRFSPPLAIGLQRVIEPPTAAVLYLRVNDSAARLSDNQGSLSASIRRVDD